MPRLVGVYPRTHGETNARRATDTRYGGLSPYTRGNLPVKRQSINQQRSIPVHTGKPNEVHLKFLSGGVYPRTHGETTDDRFSPEPVWGLSPYTRGNQIGLRHKTAMTGSIPVHTGKPALHFGKLRLQKVYPRTHGETRAELPILSACGGLSPYTRGNPIARRPYTLPMRSIPVHTGKPSITLFVFIKDMVYPRTHGETLEYHPMYPLFRGLSPYTRGNPRCRF